jgi:regulator of protease activity HflC (stomatin/prohibitin superfamily)
MRKIIWFALIVLSLSGCRATARLRGELKVIRAEAELEAQSHLRQVEVEQAEAELEASHLYAQIEIERAKGVAEANKIIGDSLDGNDAYLRYLWIQGLHDGSSETIYIPTEANLPLLEARDN